MTDRQTNRKRQTERTDSQSEQYKTEQTRRTNLLLDAVLQEKAFDLEPGSLRVCIRASVKCRELRQKQEYDRRSCSANPEPKSTAGHCPS